MRRVILSAAVLALVNVGVPSASTAAESASPASLPFDYVHSPLDVQVGAALPSPMGDLNLQGLTYLKLTGGRNAATLVAPGTPGRHPAVLFVHWYDPESPNSNRMEFLDEAAGLAQSGVVSLLIDTMWTDTKWFNTRNPGDDLPNSVAQVKELRRALDVLIARPEVDPKRVVYVGHDFGAMYGSLLGVSDHRVSAYVLIAGTKSFSDWYLLGRKLEGDAREAVVRELSIIDPAQNVGAIAPSPILFQFGTQDPYVPAASADAFFAGAREPKEMRRYDCGHAMNAAAAAERIAWVKVKLGL